jgi:hypothetical protein
LAEGGVVEVDSAAQTWGLVVGIDEYDEPAIRRLTGAAADGVAAVGWLRELGVPDAQILLHATPCAGTAQAVAALGLPRRDALWPSIRASLGKLREQSLGSRLFVFLSGHGVFEPSTSHRMFLTQDYGAGGFWEAIDLENLITLLLSTRFKQQFLFVDGCQNYPYSQNQRPTINASHPPLAGITIQPGNGLIACFSASQGQYALEINGRGAMMGALLQSLDCNRLRQLGPGDPVLRDAVIFDWHTGRREIDLQKLFYRFVQPKVELAASQQHPPQEQTPGTEARGAATQRLMSILRLPVEPTATVQIDVSPTGATDQVEEIHIRTERPIWDYFLPVPPGTSIAVPETCVVPHQASVTIECHLREGTRWTIAPPDQIRIQAQTQIRALFNLLPANPPPPPSPEPLEAYNLRLLKPDGNVDHIFPQIYLDVASLGSSIAPEGVRMEHHEHGPDFFIGPADLDAAGDFARRWASAVRQHPLARGHELVLAPPGRSVQRSRTNLQFDMPLPYGLAGFLSDQKLVFIEPAQAPEQPPPWQSGVHGDYSLLELFALGGIRVRRGLTRIRIDLPWGRWIDTVDVMGAEIPTVKVPSSIGIPPLRIGLGADEPSGALILRHREGWYYQYPGWPIWGGEAHFNQLALEGYEGVRFARHRDRTLIVDTMSEGPRVEPFLATKAIEWDLLIGKGRLDALPPAALSDLCGRWASGEMSGADDELLGLAIAYAAYAGGHWDNLALVLARVAALGGKDILDCAILYELRRGLDRNRPANPTSPLGKRLAAGEMPLFRWGVALARDLFADRIENLRVAAAQLRPNSVWTCWVNNTTAQNTRSDS